MWNETDVEYVARDVAGLSQALSQSTRAKYPRTFFGRRIVINFVAFGL